MPHYSYYLHLLNTFADLAPAPNVTMNSVMHFCFSTPDEVHLQVKPQKPVIYRPKGFVW